MFFKNQCPELRDVDIGEFTIGRPSIRWMTDENRVTIGKFCVMLPNVKIFAGGNHHIDWVTTYPFYAFDCFPFAQHHVHEHTYSNGPVHIGHGVWIGTCVTIMSGVTIGNGAIIASGSVVTKDIQPYAVVAGNPAKQIGLRFTNAQCRVLEKAAWWNWELKDIMPKIKLLMGNDIKNFLAVISQGE